MNMRYSKQNQRGGIAPESLGGRIKAARARHGLSQSQAANQWGIVLRTLQDWEQGNRTPKGLALRMLEKIIKR